MALSMLLLGCSTEPKEPHTASVFNFLLEPVRTSAGGIAYGTIQPNDNSVLTIPGGVSTLTVTPAHEYYTDGSQVPDDVTSFDFHLNGATPVIDVSNVQGGAAYFAPRITNLASVAVSIAVVDGSNVRCLLRLDPTFDVTQLGYYRLTATVEMRVYRFGNSCTGSYLTWPNSQLTQLMETKSGRVLLGNSATP